ncbi:RNB domain-containing protein [Phthorimaea operculella]|nr:RNB domain-containing protein [Phthorimaea operculella]
MWTTKTFLTKTKRGNILKIVREHYLRDDLLCGSAACIVCPHKDDEFVLDAKPESVCALFEQPHYLMLDTNVVLHQIDVLEEDALTNVIILQTVLEEVKHQNTAIFQRLLEIIGNKKRKFYSFVNEHHKDTYVERQPGEKVNDRNDRAIRKAASWYTSHLSANRPAREAPDIVLLSDDENNRKLAIEEGIICCTVKDYIENVNGFPGLVDKLSKNIIPESCSRDALYPAHLTPAQVHSGIRAGKLHQGTFHASRDNFLEATAAVPGFEKPVHSGIRAGKLHQGTFHASRDNFLEATAAVPGFEKPVHSGIRAGKLHQGTFHASRDNFLEATAAVPGFEKPVHSGIRAGKLHQGTFHASRDNFLEATAAVPGFEKPVHSGIRAGKLHQGTFHASRDNFLEATAAVPGFEKPILLQGHIGINRAVDGDVVAIEIFPEEEWRRPSDIVLEDKTDDPGDLLEEEALLLNAPKADKKDDEEVTPTGKVVGIIRRKWRQYCGILQPSKFPGATRHLFCPAEKRIPRVRIETRQSDKLASQRILVALDSWPRNSRYPLGHFVRALGPIGDKDAENEVILLEHDVPHARFSEAVLACLPPDDWTIPPEEIKKRVDLRGITICSVDPPGCTDIDDALHARPIEGTTSTGLKKYEVGVHIADVTHFVRPNTALDKEAAARSTTVYLVDKRIDMVPDLLSSNLCSLRGGEERLAFSCVWEIDENANVLSTKFHKSVIKSKAAMTYEEAQIAIDDSTRNDDVALSLRTLNKLAKKLKQKRLDNGALLLASPEIRFQVDSETHDPIEVQAKKIVDTNSMVEEFMLLANVSVAEKLAAEFPQCAMLRRHPAPPPANFTTFLKAARQQGFELDVSTNKSFSKSLNEAVIPGRPFFNTLLRIMATRCMQQAQYFSSGTRTQEEFYHYGLACPIYTHFTSPIRRYADVIVHRLLAACIGADVTHANLLDTKEADAICDNLNYRHRQAQYAGRASVALNTHILFKERVEIESAVVLAVKRNALQVLIPKYGLEGPLYLPNNIFTYNEEEHLQRAGDVVLKTFDEITVRLALDSTNIQHRKLMFQLVTPHVPGFSHVPDQEMKEESGEKMEVDDVKVEKEASNKKRKEQMQEKTETKSKKKSKKK